MPEKDRLSEELKYRIELLRLLWLTMLAVGTGVLGILAALVSALALAAAGIALLVLLGGMSLYQQRRIQAILTHMQEVR